MCHQKLHILTRHHALREFSEQRVDREQNLASNLGLLRLLFGFSLFAGTSGPAGVLRLVFPDLGLFLDELTGGQERLETDEAVGGHLELRFDTALKRFQRLLVCDANIASNLTEASAVPCNYMLSQAR